MKSLEKSLGQHGGVGTKAGMSSGSFSIAMPAAHSWPVAPQPNACCPGHVAATASSTAVAAAR